MAFLEEKLDCVHRNMPYVDLFFFSETRHASVTGKRSKCKCNKIKYLFVKTAGIYLCLLSQVDQKSHPNDCSQIKDSEYSPCSNRMPPSFIIFDL